MPNCSHWRKFDIGVSRVVAVFPGVQFADFRDQFVELRMPSPVGHVSRSFPFHTFGVFGINLLDLLIA
jgi:hypothetical protein